MRVVVVGGGLAGTAAALAARANGASTTLLLGRAGSSVLASGAWDGAPTDDAIALLRSIEAPVVVEKANVVTSAGVVRACEGRDAQVLALPADGAVAVVDAPFTSWFAPALVKSLEEQGVAAKLVPATLTRTLDELRRPFAEVAALHDDEARGGWLGDRIKEALAGAGEVAAVLAPPILGTSAAAHRRIRARLGDAIALGETLADPGGPCAFRFPRWRDAALTAAKVDVIDGDALHVAYGAVRAKVAGETRALPADRVVLAIGGVAAGGLTFGGGEHEAGGAMPAEARAMVRPSVSIAAGSDREVVAWADDRPIDVVASLFGVDGERVVAGDPPWLLRAGLSIDANARVVDRARAALAWLFAAGDVVAGGDRTAFASFSAGVRAGRAAASG